MRLLKAYYFKSKILVFKYQPLIAMINKQSPFLAQMVPIIALQNLHLKLMRSNNKQNVYELQGYLRNKDTRGRVKANLALHERYFSQKGLRHLNQVSFVEVQPVKRSTLKNSLVLKYFSTQLCSHEIDLIQIFYPKQG